MVRHNGIMPMKEVKKQRKYMDIYGDLVTVQAGSNGWTVIFSDGKKEFLDNIDTVDNNFDAAIKVAVDVLGELTECQRFMTQNEK